MIPASNERPRTPLGTLILRAGLLREEQIADALREGERTGRRLGEILVQRGLLGPGDLARMLARQTDLAFVELADVPLDRHAVGLVTEDGAIRDRVLPYRFEGGTPIVAIADPTDDIAKANLHEALKREFRLTVTTEEDLAAAIARAFGRQSERPAQPTTLGGGLIRTTSSPTLHADVRPTAPPDVAAPPREDSPSAPTAPAAPAPAAPAAPIPAPVHDSVRPDPVAPRPDAAATTDATATPAASEAHPPVATPAAAEAQPAAATPETHVEEWSDNVVVPLWDGPLGALLVRSELLTSEQVEDALREAARRGRRLGEIVLERGWIHERTLATCLAGQKNLPFVSLKDSIPDRDALRLLPAEVALRYGALPIHVEDGALTVVVADPTNEAAMESVRSAAAVDVRFNVAAASELASAVATAYEPGPASTAAPVSGEHPPEAEERAPAPEREERAAAPEPEAHAPVPEPEERPPAREAAERFSALQARAEPAKNEVATAAETAFRVLVRLSHGERVAAGVFPDLRAAEARAKELMRQIAQHGSDEWPLVNGRFLRPDGIISVDIAETTDAVDEPLPKNVP